jgi:brefeldin A-resistance guanine nucleotide exchange factor 1
VLQKSLLLSDLERMNGLEWQKCLDKVLFPLLTRLLGPLPTSDSTTTEEIRMRACTLLCKVHLKVKCSCRVFSIMYYTFFWLQVMKNYSYIL